MENIAYPESTKHGAPVSRDDFVAHVETLNRDGVIKLLIELNEDEDRIKQLFLDAEAVELVKDLGALSAEGDDFYLEDDVIDDSSEEGDNAVLESDGSDTEPIKELSSFSAEDSNIVLKDVGANAREEEIEPIEPQVRSPSHPQTLKWTEDILGTINLRSSGSSRELKTILETIQLKKMLCSERLKQLDEFEQFAKEAEEIAQREEEKEREERARKYYEDYEASQKLITAHQCQQLACDLGPAQNQPSPTHPYRLNVEMARKDSVIIQTCLLYFASIEAAHDYLQKWFNFPSSRTIALGIRELVPTHGTYSPYDVFVTLLRV